MRFERKADAVRAFVSELNAIRVDIISVLMKYEPDGWMELTMPAVGDRVCVDSVDIEDTTADEGEVVKADGENYKYKIKMDDGVVIDVSGDDFYVLYDDKLPMWGYLWQFSDPCDIEWIKNRDGVIVMSELGFRIYEHNEYGVFFGIDGAGFDFYEAYWTPLYDARGLKWHDKE